MNAGDRDATAPCQSAANNSPQQPEGQVFSCELPNQNKSFRTHSCSQRNFAGTPGIPCQQQIGNVRARDKKDEDNCAHKHPEDRTQIRDLVLLEWPELYADALIKRILCGEIFSDALKIRVRLLNANSWLQSTNRRPTASTSLAFFPDGAAGSQVRNKRSPDFGLALRIPHPPIDDFIGHDRDDRVGLVVDANAFAKDRAISVKTRLPEVVTDNRFEMIPEPVLLIFEQPAHQRLHSEDFEIFPWD